MQSYFRKVCDDLTRIGGDMEPSHIGILAVVVVVLGYFLLRGMNLKPGR